MAHLVSFRDVRKRFGRNLVLDRISGEVVQGEAVAITGPNGSGKSTLLKILAGILRADAGTVDRAAASGLASPDLMFYRELSARENLEFFGRLAGNPAPVADLLRRVGLDPAAHDRAVGAFSSGMLQRVRLAFAIQAGAPLLLLDEPGSNLDAAGKEVVAGLVEEWKGRGAVLIATNDPDEVALTGREIRVRVAERPQPARGADAR